MRATGAIAGSYRVKHIEDLLADHLTSRTSPRARVDVVPLQLGVSKLFGKTLLFGAKSAQLALGAVLRATIAMYQCRV